MNKKGFFKYLIVGYMYFFICFGIFLAILSPFGIGNVTINGVLQEGWNASLWSLLIAIGLGLGLTLVTYFVVEVGHKIRSFFPGGKNRPKAVIGDGKDDDEILSKKED